MIARDGSGASVISARGSARPRRLRGVWIVCAGLPLCLVGCATSPDPHQGGFISGIVGLAGGGYQQRIDERQGTYQVELDAQQRLKAQAREVEQERTAVKGDLARANARLAALQQRIAQQRAMLRTAGGPSAARQGELRRLDQAQAQVKRTQGALRGVHPDQQPVTDLKARSAAIQRDLDQIDGMVATVSGKGF